jgi:phosphate starvation-inducible protein PhoH and related proteins
MKYMSRARATKKNSHISYMEEDRALSRSSSFNESIETKAFIKPATTNQRLFVRAIKDNDIIIGTGPSGCGKTILAVHTAITLINSDSSPIERLIYVRSNVDMDEEDGLGFIPGGLIEKSKPLAYPLLDNMIQFMARGTAEYLIDSGKIEVMTLSMLRGRSFPNAVILADELQNASPKGVKTLLTRIGENSKMIITGDSQQQDRPRLGDGLGDLISRVRSFLRKPLDGGYSIDMVEFTEEDVVRNGIIRTILKLYPEAG